MEGISLGAGNKPLDWLLKRLERGGEGSFAKIIVIPNRISKRNGLIFMDGSLQEMPENDLSKVMEKLRGLGGRMALWKVGTKARISYSNNSE